MRRPVWETTPGALADLLNSVTRFQLRMIDLYRITTASGLVLRYSGGDEEVSIAGETWELGPVVRRGRTRLTATVEVDSLDVTLSAPAGVQVNGLPLIHFITAGGLDGARLQLWRAFSPGPGANWVGALDMFSGAVGAIKGGRHEKRLSVRSDIDLLNAKIPRNVYQPACLNNLYDARCGVSRSAWERSETCSVASDSQRMTFGHAATGVAVDAWALGQVVFSTGANAGITRTVARNSGTTLSVIEPWPFAVAAGDQFKVWPGCDRTRSTCITKFANLGRFRGMPYIPIAETVT